MSQELYRQKAATQIQAAYRAHFARQNLLSAEEEFKKKNKSSFHCNATKMENKVPSNELEPTDLEVAAATKIQASYRGHLARKHLNSENEEEPGEEQQEPKQDSEESVHEHLTEPQDNLEPEPISEPQENEVKEDTGTNVNACDSLVKLDNVIQPVSADDAATRIQATYRGYRVRKAYADQLLKKTQKNKRESYAAAKIQAGYRGYTTRKELLKAAKAATRIQRVYRRYKMSKTSKNNDEITEAQAATTIQAGYRGYKTRKSLKSQNAAEDNKYSLGHVNREGSEILEGVKISKYERELSSHTNIEE